MLDRAFTDLLSVTSALYFNVFLQKLLHPLFNLSRLVAIFEPNRQSEWG
jgi:hypothetical protein